MTTIAIRSSTPKKRAELAQLITKGLAIGVNEDNNYFLLQEGCGAPFACALGTAMIGRFGDFETALSSFYRARGSTCNDIDENVRAIALCLDTHKTLCGEVNTLHMSGVCTSEIVSALRAA